MQALNPHIHPLAGQDVELLADIFGYDDLKFG
jgi:hypothetical protein